jgi:glycosyltransferase involved in cell wall biosynthesis
MSLYRHPKIKCLVSLTRGEGYGLPILEAAVSELPVIATDWSGHLDFMNKGRFSAVEYELIDIHQSRIDNVVFMEGSRWAMPKEKEAKRRLKKFRTSSKIPKQWAEELAPKLLADFSQEAINSIYDECLTEFIE